MNDFVIRKEGKGRFYVAMPDSKKAYTTSIEKARKFKSFEDAKKDCCGNEYPVKISELF